MEYSETELRNKNRGCRKLIVWNEAVDPFQLAWKISFIESKIDFKLRSQFADATQSLSSNIAEGYGRRSINEYIQFLYTSLGSTVEALSRAIGLQRTKQISNARFNDFNLLHYEVENRLLRLVEKVGKKRDAGDWVNQISEDPSAYLDESELHPSTTPSLHPGERDA